MYRRNRICPNHCTLRDPGCNWDSVRMYPLQKHSLGPERKEVLYPEECVVSSAVIVKFVE